MKHRAVGLVSFISVLCLSALSANVMGATINKVQIKDPALLQSMGFAPDAANVYQSMGVGKGANDGVVVNSDFGTSTRFTSIAPKSYIGRANTAATPWEYNGGNSGCCNNLSRTGPETFADAAFYLPDGVVVSGARFWATDTNAASDMAFFVFESCYPAFGAGPSTHTLLNTIGGLETSGSAGDQSAFEGFTATIDNQNCVYLARVRFDATTGLSLQKFRFQWSRQISPAPAVASFSDVPTSHPFFQPIQALAATGITTGCTATTFCPDAAVTRGQMAAFLSRALGL